MSYHSVRGLLEVQLAEPPRGVKAKSLGGTKGQGLRFEKLVAQGLPEATHGQWLRFLDREGWHYCQPDLFFVSRRFVVILEVKRTDCGLARGQILNLYGPVLERLYGKPFRGIVVAKYLAGKTDLRLVASSLAEALPMTRLGIPTLHWPGRGEFPVGSSRDMR